MGEVAEVLLEGARHEAFGADGTGPVVAAEEVGVGLLGVGVFVGEAEVVEEFVGEGGVAVVGVPVELVGSAGVRIRGEGDGFAVVRGVDEFGGDTELVAAFGQAVAGVGVRVEDLLGLLLVPGEVGGGETVGEFEGERDEEVADRAAVGELLTPYVGADEGDGPVEVTGAGVQLAEFRVEALGVDRGGPRSVEGAQFPRGDGPGDELAPPAPARRAGGGPRGVRARVGSCCRTRASTTAVRTVLPARTGLRAG
ncbi:hypothetical protein DRB89_41775 [Streptomyces sp. ICC4]|nr:hypothetical protein DRB89_41775 [Streptomyces sp. ICC4]